MTCVVWFQSQKIQVIKLGKEGGRGRGRGGGGGDSAEYRYPGSNRRPSAC
jgi:hypothetical protein